MVALERYRAHPNNLGQWLMNIEKVVGPYRGTNGLTWDIKTDLDPATLSAVGAQIAKAWIDYAMGRLGLGGRTIMHPTGRMASAISYRETGEARIAVMANEKWAPEAGYIEEPRKAVDLKEYFRRGQRLPMHRGPKGQYGSKGYGPPILSNTSGARRKNVWAKPRAQGSSGYAYVGATGWIIPAMPAFSPAAHLVDMMRNGAFDV